MSSKLYSYKLVRYWDVYDTEDICAVFADKKLHPQTVRKWIKNALKAIDNGKPALVYGNDLIVFLKKQNTKNKCVTAFDELFCMACQDARPIYCNKITVTQKTNMLAVCGLCRSCKTKMFQNYKLDDFPRLRKIFRVVGVLELYDYVTSSGKTHIHAPEHQPASESVQGMLF
jgi:hypothetical protein